MEYSETKINSEVSARVYYSKLGRQIYLVDDEGNEIAEVSLCKGVDLSSFSRIISDRGEYNDSSK